MYCLFLCLFFVCYYSVESCSIGVAFGQSSFTDLDFADDVSLLAELEVTARHLNEVEAVQQVYLTNIPVWFGLLGNI